MRCKIYDACDVLDDTSSDKELFMQSTCNVCSLSGGFRLMDRIQRFVLLDWSHIRRQDATTIGRNLSLDVAAFLVFLSYFSWTSPRSKCVCVVCTIGLYQLNILLAATKTCESSIREQWEDIRAGLLDDALCWHLRLLFNWSEFILQSHSIAIFWSFKRLLDYKVSSYKQLIINISKKSIWFMYFFVVGGVIKYYQSGWKYFVTFRWPEKIIIFLASSLATYYAFGEFLSSAGVVNEGMAVRPAACPAALPDACPAARPAARPSARPSARPAARPAALVVASLQCCYS